MRQQVCCTVRLLFGWHAKMQFTAWSIKAPTCTLSRLRLQRLKGGWSKSRRHAPQPLLPELGTRVTACVEESMDV